MFRLKNLFSLLVTLCFLASCEKVEWDKTFDTQTTSVAESSTKSLTEVSAPITLPILFSQHAYIGCVSGFGMCTDPFLPDDLTFEVSEQGNVGLAEVYIEEDDNSLVFEVDGGTLSESFVTNAIETPTFTVSSDIVIPTELVNEVYENSGLPVPNESLVIPSGKYNVEVEETPEGLIIIVVGVVVADKLVVFVIIF